MRCVAAGRAAAARALLQPELRTTAGLRGLPPIGPTPDPPTPLRATGYPLAGDGGARAGARGGDRRLRSRPLPRTRQRVCPHLLIDSTRALRRSAPVYYTHAQRTRILYSRPPRPNASAHLLLDVGDDGLRDLAALQVLGLGLIVAEAEDGALVQRVAPARRHARRSSDA